MDFFNNPEQPELFDEFFQRKLKFLKKRTRFKKPYISVSIENLIICLIAVFMTMIICYSLGVESGKKQVIAAPSTKQPETKKYASEKSAVEESAQPPGKSEQKEKPKTASKPQTYYTVQLATYLQKKHAKKQIALLKRKGTEAFILSSGKYYFLCSGKYPTYQEAKNETKKLRKSFQDCFVKKIENQWEVK